MSLNSRAHKDLDEEISALFQPFLDDAHHRLVELLMFARSTSLMPERFGAMSEVTTSKEGMANSARSPSTEKSLMSLSQDDVRQGQRRHGQDVEADYEALFPTRADST